MTHGPCHVSWPVCSRNLGCCWNPPFDVNKKGKTTPPLSPHLTTLVCRIIYRLDSELTSRETKVSNTSIVSTRDGWKNKNKHRFSCTLYYNSTIGKSSDVKFTYVIHLCKLRKWHNTSTMVIENGFTKVVGVVFETRVICYRGVKEKESRRPSGIKWKSIPMEYIDLNVLNRKL